MDLGIIDSLWDVSIYREASYIELMATSRPGTDNGWYRAIIGFDGRLQDEKRMLPDGNYDREPATNRPNMRAIIASIPKENEEAIAMLRLAYGAQA